MRSTRQDANKLLLEAIKSNNLNDAQKAIRDGADINLRSAVGDTPLYTAARLGHTAIVAFLLESGADVNMTTSQSYTPIAIAAAYGNMESIRLLLSKNPRLFVKEHGSVNALFNAAYYRKDEAVKLILNHIFVNFESFSLKNIIASDPRDPSMMHLVILALVDHPDIYAQVKDELLAHFKTHDGTIFENSYVANIKQHLFELISKIPDPALRISLTDMAKEEPGEETAKNPISLIYHFATRSAKPTKEKGYLKQIYDLHATAVAELSNPEAGKQASQKNHKDIQTALEDAIKTKDEDLITVYINELAEIFSKQPNEDIKTHLKTLDTKYKRDLRFMQLFEAACAELKQKPAADDSDDFSRAIAESLRANQPSPFAPPASHAQLYPQAPMSAKFAVPSYVPLAFASAEKPAIATTSASLLADIEHSINNNDVINANIKALAQLFFNHPEDMQYIMSGLQAIDKFFKTHLVLQFESELDTPTAITEATIAQPLPFAAANTNAPAYAAPAVVNKGAYANAFQVLRDDSSIYAALNTPAADAPPAYASVIAAPPAYTYQQATPSAAEERSNTNAQSSFDHNDLSWLGLKPQPAPAAVMEFPILTAPAALVVDPAQDLLQFTIVDAPPVTAKPAATKPAPVKSKQLTDFDSLMSIPAPMQPTRQNQFANYSLLELYSATPQPAAEPAQKTETPPPAYVAVAAPPQAPANTYATQSMAPVGIFKQAPANVAKQPAAKAPSQGQKKPGRTMLTE